MSPLEQAAGFLNKYIPTDYSASKPHNPFADEDMREAISSGIVQIDLPDSQRKPNKSR